MDCKKLREFLDAYVDGELSPDASAQARSHVAECGPCRRAADRLFDLRKAIKNAAGEAEAPVELGRRIRTSVAPPWHRSLPMQALAAAVLFAVVLIVLVPTLRGAAANTLDYLSMKLDDSQQVVLKGQLVCRDCVLNQKYGYPAKCRETGHHGSLATSDGRMWSLLEGDASQDLIHNPSLLGRKVEIQGRIFRQAGSIEVAGYRML